MYANCIDLAVACAGGVTEVLLPGCHEFLRLELLLHRPHGDLLPACDMTEVLLSPPPRIVPLESVSSRWASLSQSETSHAVTNGAISS